MANKYNGDQKKLTLQSIEEALIALMMTKSFNGIGISELCMKAGVSRMAFYRHFESLQDVLKSHLLRQQIAFLGRIRLEKEIHHRKIGHEYLSMIAEEKSFYKAFFKSGMQWILMDFLKNGMDLFNREFEPAVNRNPEEKAYLISYDAGGFLALIARWLETDCEDSIEFILDILLKRR